MDTGASQGEFPVDDATYNLLQTLVSKLESLDAYRNYMKDMSGGEERAIFQELRDQDRQHAERLLAAVKERLAKT
jgi:hypothetical protein